MAEMIGGGRPVTTCSICLGSDDHPVHSVLAPDGSGWLDYHLDCHALRGCPDCVRRTEDRPEGAVGVAMFEHLAERVADGRADGDGGVMDIPGYGSPAASDDDQPAPATTMEM